MKKKNVSYSRENKNLSHNNDINSSRKSPQTPSIKNESIKQTRRAPANNFNIQSTEQPRQRQMYDQKSALLSNQRQRNVNLNIHNRPSAPLPPPQENISGARRRIPSKDKAQARITRGEARKRRTRRRILWAVLLVLVIIIGVVLSVTVLFKIESYVVEGESPYAGEELWQAFGHETGENIFSFKIIDAENKVAAALPYLEEVSVRRRLPTTIVFKTIPAIETYYVECLDGGYAVLSKKLKVLRTSADKPEDLKLISGVQPVLPKAGYELELEKEDIIASLTNVLTALESSTLSDFISVNIADKLEISFVYQNRIRVLLGTANDLEDKIIIATEILKNQIGETERGVLDVSRQNPNKGRQGVWDPGEM